MKNNSLMSAIDGYEKTGGQKRFISHNLSGRLTALVNRSRILRSLSRAEDIMAYSSARVYGTALLVWGLLTILIQFTKSALNMGGEHVFSTLITGAVIALASTPLMVTDKPFCLIFNDFYAADFILFEFFRMKRMPKKEISRVSPLWGIVFGALIAAFTVFLPAWAVLAAVATLLFLYLSLLSPEFSFFSTLLLLPLISIFDFSSIILAILTAVTALSLAKKIILGKRVYYFEQYDFIIGIITVLIFVNVMLSPGAGAFNNALLCVLILLGYFSASNIITNRRLAECSLYAISISSIPVSVIAIIQFILRITEDGTSFLTTDVTSTMKSGGAFCAYLVATVIASFAMSFDKRKRNHGIFYFSVGVLGILALALAARIDAILILIAVGFLISLAIKDKKALILSIIIYIFAHIPLILPQSAIEILSGISHDVYTAVSEWREVIYNTLSLVAEKPLFGILDGKESFYELTEGLFGKGYASAGNLFVQILAELGVLVLIAFIFLFAARLRHIINYADYTKRSKVDALSLSVFAATFATVTIGAVSDVFIDSAVVVLFFVMFGIGSALLRIARNEYDAKQDYFTDNISANESTVDVSISPKNKSGH